MAITFHNTPFDVYYVIDTAEDFATWPEAVNTTLPEPLEWPILVSVGDTSNQAVNLSVAKAWLAKLLDSWLVPVTNKPAAVVAGTDEPVKFRSHTPVRRLSRTVDDFAPAVIVTKMGRCRLSAAEKLLLVFLCKNKTFEGKQLRSRFLVLNKTTYSKKLHSVSYKLRDSMSKVFPEFEVFSKSDVWTSNLTEEQREDILAQL